MLSPSSINPEDIEILSQLGEGSFGKVYLGKLNSDSSLYALKAINKEKLSFSVLKKYSLSEKNILSSVSHKNIVKMYLNFQSKTHSFLLLEYGPGKDLADYLDEEGGFSEAKARFYICQGISAINELHRKGIIYRDLKPNNIVLDSEGNIRLINFNLSKSGFTNRMKRTNSFCGSYAYMPPEVIQRKEYGKNIDWYLLGVLMYEMLSGLPPYFNKDEKVCQRNILRNKLTTPEYITPEGTSLLKKLLHKDPNKRLGIKGGATEILNHPWFLGITLEEIDNGKLKPFEPYLKQIETNPRSIE